jgi:pyruvate/2-oxoglutarate dehydrogenase complex dihydrolipoamide acyltransferase (E2) component
LALNTCSDAGCCTRRRCREIDGRIETREYLSMTVAIDHDVIDDASAARFAQQLTELVESGYRLYGRQ